MNIGLVAHDQRKNDLIEWVKFNTLILSDHHLICTGTGAKITADEIDLLIFFWDPMSSQPHDPDVKALLRMTVIYNIPTACNRASADYMISSPLFEDKDYTRIIKDYTPYMNREL